MALRLGEALAAVVAWPCSSILDSGFFQHASLAAWAADLCHAPASRLQQPRLVRMCREEPKYPPHLTMDLAPYGECRWLACQCAK
eukprot:2455228-Heterocapsa_arctica.AAC.1